MYNFYIPVKNLKFLKQKIAFIVFINAFPFCLFHVTQLEVFEELHLLKEKQMSFQVVIWKLTMLIVSIMGEDLAALSRALSIAA